MRLETAKILQIRLIRHGESEVNARHPPIIGGRSSWCELTEGGILQARALGRWLAASGAPCDRVIASSAVRAQQTARYCLEEAGIALRTIEIFREIEELSQGSWEGALRSEVLTPETLARIEELHWNFRPPGGEALADVAERVNRWLMQEILRKPPGDVWIFCHGIVIKVLLAECFGLDRRFAWQIAIDHTSMTTIARRGDRWALLDQNSSPHLS